jgi:hypothetical protein
MGLKKKHQKYRQFGLSKEMSFLFYLQGKRNFAAAVGRGPVQNYSPHNF